MRDLSRFKDETFDFIFHPVSNLFIPDVCPVWREAYRVLRHGGTLLAGFLNPILYLFDFEKAEQGMLEVKFKLPYADTDHPEIAAKLQAEGEALEHSHSLTDQLGGQLEAGFQIIDLYEDSHTDLVFSEYMPTFLATRARKP